MCPPPHSSVSLELLTNPAAVSAAPPPEMHPPPGGYAFRSTILSVLTFVSFMEDMCFSALCRLLASVPTVCKPSPQLYLHADLGAGREQSCCPDLFCTWQPLQRLTAKLLYYH